jgi:hypothetical protein
MNELIVPRQSSARPTFTFHKPGTRVAIMITYEASDGWKPVAFSHPESAYTKHCNHWKSCLDSDCFLQDAQIESHVPRIGDVEGLNERP